MFEHSRGLCSSVIMMVIVCGYAAAGRSQSVSASRLDLLCAYLMGPGSGEIVDISPDGRTLAATDYKRVILLNLDEQGRLTPKAEVDLWTVFGGLDQIGSVSSTAIDPRGRGFGVVAVIPSERLHRLGKVAFFDMQTGGVLGTLDTGFHPDSVKITKDGAMLLIANEGEYTTGGDADRPGSLTVIDLSQITSVGDVMSHAVRPMTYDLSASHRAAGVDLSRLRYNDRAFTPGQESRHIEPEFMAVADGKVFVTLQENNAIGVFDLGVRRWVAMYDLGTVTVTIDASDRDGVDISDVVEGLPMPDAIAAFHVGGRTYLATANEGDFRPDNGDRRRASDFSGLDGIEADMSKEGVGKLRLSIPDADPDGDGRLNRIVVPGTRGFSLWDAATGKRVGDSGSLEGFLLRRDPARHNTDDGGDPAKMDDRSRDKGPEPEGLDVIHLPHDVVLLAVGMERQNGIVLADVSDPTNPVLIDYINSFDEGLRRPESLRFVPASRSPTGTTLLIVGYEGGREGGIGVYAVR